MDLILLGHILASQTEDTFEFEADLVAIGDNTMERTHGIQAAPHQLGFPFPKLEILMFDGVNSRWWVRAGVIGCLVFTMCLNNNE